MNLPEYWAKAKEEHAKKLVRLVYTDEAGTASEEQEPFTVVASVTVNGDTQWRGLESDVADLRERLEVPLGVELKAHNLFWGRQEFQPWGREKRKELQMAFLSLLLRYKLDVSAAIIERAHFRKLLEPYTPEQMNYHPQDLAFLVCAGEVESHFCAEYPGEVGAVVADDSDRAVQLKKSFAEYRRKPLPGLYRSKFNHLIEPILFGSSHESWGLQLADQCAFFIKRGYGMLKEDSYEFYDLFRSRITGSPFIASAETEQRHAQQLTALAVKRLV